MKTSLLKISLIIVSFVFSLISSFAQQELKRDSLFDFGWKFHLGGAQGAESPAFNDSGWRDVDLPHDWSIEDLQGTISPFNINAISQVSGGFTTGGTGWYRKTFFIPENLKGKCFRILFEGIYMNSELFLNGIRLGNHPYGYTSFWYDVTDKIKPGSANVLSVKVMNEGENSRWYSGSGIYRHVWLQVLNNQHIETWGISITTPEVKSEEARINVLSTLNNQAKTSGKIKLTTTISGPDGQKILQKEDEAEIGPGKQIQLVQLFSIRKPLLWSPESPSLYMAESSVYDNGYLVDQTVTFFGIRSISFDPQNGFLLNGKSLKLKGGCVHHDNGPLGSKAYDRAEERRVELLKVSGFNAIRCAHNPPSPAFLDACDRLGMLVMDEAFDMWKDGKNPADYHLYFNDWWEKDVESMVNRDRNHPSVIMWSIGNEIPNKNMPEVVETAKTLGRFIRKIDPTRPVTSAVDDLNPDKDPYFATLDVGGYNYAARGEKGTESLYSRDHSRVPDRVMVGTESFPLLAFESWMDVTDNPYVIGDFVWTSFDYIGEASIGWRGYFQKQNFFPWNLAYCGDIDICGWKRAQSFYRDALWKENQLSVWVTPPEPSFEPNPERQPWSKWHWLDVVSSWNWEGYEGKNIEVSVYSSCDQVELFLNGRSLGKKTTDRSTEFMATWEVTYQPGALTATGYKGKKKVAVSELKTAGIPTDIKLTADRQVIHADGQDLSYVTVEIRDANNLLNPLAENEIRFEIEGPGKIIATGNSNPVSLESFQLPVRKLWHGKCLVIVKSDRQKGKIVLTASSKGLNSGSVGINCE